MKRNNRSFILAMLIITTVAIWMPKGKKPAAVSADTSEQAIPVIAAVPKKSTEFVDWGRNPFTFSQGEEKSGGIPNLELNAIMWSANKPSAFINNSILTVGDKITNKTIKRIEQNRVILTDGVKDYVLELHE